MPGLFWSFSLGDGAVVGYACFRRTFKPRLDAMVTAQTTSRSLNQQHY